MCYEIKKIFIDGGFVFVISWTDLSCMSQEMQSAIGFINFSQA